MAFDMARVDGDIEDYMKQIDWVRHHFPADTLRWHIDSLNLIVDTQELMVLCIR